MSSSFSSWESWLQVRRTITFLPGEPSQWEPTQAFSRNTKIGKTNIFKQKQIYSNKYKYIQTNTNTNNMMPSHHPASHVTLWLSSGKFASGSDFKGGAFFLKGGAFFVGILPPLIFREMMQKPTPFFLPPLIIFGKKRAPLNNWKHFYCPPEFCPAFWKPPLNLNGDLKPLLVPPWFFLAFSKPPLKLKSKISAPLNHAEQKHMSDPLKKGHF